MNTILYPTDNSLPEGFAARVQDILQREAGGLPIVSVSQEPIPLGHNVCVGRLGRSWLSLYRQLLAGLKIIATPFVVIAEHDCLYTHEHLHWQPPRPDVFYYNHNCWLCQWAGRQPGFNGMFSYWPRRYALSQLICGTDLLRRATEERVTLLEEGYAVARRLPGAGEFGVVDDQAMVRAQSLARSGNATQLQSLVSRYLTSWKSEPFLTHYPNVDLRHGHNFTGPKRGKKRRHEIPYWGRMEDALGVALCNPLQPA